MSGGGSKKVVETAAKAAKSMIDWGGMAKLLISEESRKEFANLRRAFDEVNHDLQTKFGQLVELKEAEQQSFRDSERLEKEIAEVQEMKKKISTMTADEYFAKHPELKKKFDDEI